MRRRRLSSFAGLLLVLASLLVPLRVWAASCDAGADTITVERDAAADGAPQCLGTYRRFGELPAVLARGSQGAQRLRIRVGPGRYAVDGALVIDGAQLKGVAVDIVGAGVDRSTVVGSVPVGGAAGPWIVSLDAATIGRFLNTNHSSQSASKPHDLLLYDGNDRVVPGRWPQKGWGTIAAATREGDLWRLRLADASGHPAALQSGSLRLTGFPGFDWAYMAVPAQAVSADTVTVSADALHYPAKPGQRIVLEAAGGGEVDPRIVIDTTANTMSGPAGHTYDWARAAGFLRLVNMANVTVQKLALSGFAGDAITVISSSDIALTDLACARIGGRGVVITQGKRILVDHPSMRFMGEGGVDAAGGDRITLEPSEITVSNGTFERFSEIVLGYRPAVWARGVGTRIVSNRMHDAPHSAIIFEGNDHLIKGNTINDVVKDVRDSGAILVARDWTTYGTIIEDNVFAHLQGRSGLSPNGLPSDTNAVRGIYLDDFTSGITIRGNLFYEVEYGIFLNGGSDVHVLRNIFVRCNPPFAIYPWGVIYPRKLLNRHHRAVEILLGLRSQSSKLLEMYPRLKGDIDTLIVPTGDEFVENMLVDSSPAVAIRGMGGFMDLTNQGGKSFKNLVLPDPLTTPDVISVYNKLINEYGTGQSYGQKAK